MRTARTAMPTMPDHTPLNQTVKYAMGICGTDIETWNGKIADERKNWTKAEAEAKAKGYRKPFWHSARDFYEANHTRKWTELTPGQQGYALKISKALECQPIILPFPASTGAGTVDSADLPNLLKRAREITQAAKEGKRKPPLKTANTVIGKRRPKWGWTRVAK